MNLSPIIISSNKRIKEYVILVTNVHLIHIFLSSDWLKRRYMPPKSREIVALALARPSYILKHIGFIVNAVMNGDVI